MKKIGLFLIASFTSLLSFAQTGTGDDFNRSNSNYDPGTAWVQNDPTTSVAGTAADQYKLYLYQNELLVSCIDGGVNYLGFGYNFSAIDVTTAPFVSVKVKSSADFVLRIDMIDVNGRRTNQTDTKQTIKSDGVYNDYLFDFTGRFVQQYPSPALTVDKTKIVRIEFIVNAKANAKPGYNDNFYIDSLMLGSRAKTDITTGIKSIKLNQLGFFKNGYKTAVVNGATSTSFTIVNTSNVTVYTGTLSDLNTWSYSGESVRTADFSTFKTPGKYTMVTSGVPASYPFIISDTPLNTVSKASIKGFYYQRASTALPSAYAGQWARAEGHPDNAVYIHPSAVSPGRPANSQISSPKGWYDAGDYNKYIVNSGISTYTLLSCYEHFSTYYDTLNLNIPESNNTIPDVLDEALWNIRWMLTMQDPYDGGVYHKLTNKNFDGTVMPSAATDARYVVQKGTAATLDFAAVMAQSARIFSNFKTELPGLSDSCIAAAEYAYTWALANPTKYFIQSNLPAPAITTGEYGDGNTSDVNRLNDEFAWAAAELFTTTLNMDYYTMFKAKSNGSPYTPGWQSVLALAYISMGHNRVAISSEIPSDTTSIKNKLINIATGFRNQAIKQPGSNTFSAYGVAIGTGGDFYWGSNSVAANQAFILIQAFNYTKDSSFLKAALSNVDYLLGRNATGYSFVTGQGTFYSNDPHHRPSQADGVAKAVPGLLVGGPNVNPDPNEGCPSFPTQPALSYIDNSCSFSTNEIAINWNAPLAYITGSIQSIYSGISPVAKQYSVSVVTSTKNQVLKNTYINIYPNPATSSLTVEKPFDLVAKPVILDLNGREYNVTGDWSSDDIQINLSELKEGMYLIRLQGQNGAAIQKFTVIK